MPRAQRISTSMFQGGMREKEHFQKGVWAYQNSTSSQAAQWRQKQTEPWHLNVVLPGQKGACRLTVLSVIYQLTGDSLILLKMESAFTLFFFFSIMFGLQYNKGLELKLEILRQEWAFAKWELDRFWHCFTETFITSTHPYGTHCINCDMCMYSQVKGASGGGNIDISKIKDIEEVFRTMHFIKIQQVL